MDSKKIIALGAGAAAVSLSPFVAKDAKAVTQTMRAEAVVLEAITLGSGASLNFGSFTVASAGTVVVSPGGARTSTGGVGLMAGEASEQRAQLNISAAPDTQMTVEVTTTSATLTHTDGTKTMQITAFNVNNSGSNRLSSYSISGSSDVLPIGGTLTVSSGQAAGTYVGSFTVSVNYN